MRERDHLEKPSVDARVILRWILKELRGGMDWIDLASDRNWWRTRVKEVINLRVL